MNVLDTLILLNCAALSHLVTSSGYTISSYNIIYTLCLLPGSLFWICIIFKLLAKVWAKASLPVRRCFRCTCTCMQRANKEQEDSDSDADCSNQPLLQQPSSTVTATEVTLYTFSIKIILTLCTIIININIHILHVSLSSM